MTSLGHDAAGRIWVPTPGLGPDNGFRYRSALLPLDIPELREACGLALAAVERLAERSNSPLGEWAGHGPALSVYAMWAVYALRDSGSITRDDAVVHLRRLTELQRVIHYGRSAGWLAPPWWGSADIHQSHQQALIDRDGSRYSAALFAEADRFRL